MQNGQMGINDHSALVAITVVFLILSTATCSLRFWVRRMQKTHLGPDDWLVVPAYILFVAFAVLILVSVRLQLAGYVQSGTVMSSTNAILINVFALLSVAILGTVKLSALFLYRRVLCSKQKHMPFRIVLHVFMVITAIWTLIFVTFPLASCGSHLSATWDGTFSTYCKTDQMIEGYAFSDLILETIIVILPLPRIWGLQIPLRRRLSIICAFLLAFVSLGASVARTVLLAHLVKSNTIDTDPFSSALCYMLVLVECGTALVAVNLPSLYYLRTKVESRNLFTGIRTLFSRQGSDMRNTSTATKESSSNSEDFQATIIASSSSEGIPYEHRDTKERERRGILITNQVNLSYEQV